MGAGGASYIGRVWVMYCFFLLSCYVLVSCFLFPIFFHYHVLLVFAFSYYLFSFISFVLFPCLCAVRVSCVCVCVVLPPPPTIHVTHHTQGTVATPSCPADHTTSDICKLPTAPCGG